MAKLTVDQMGAWGVNVDQDPQALNRNELRVAQNAIREPLGARDGIVNRPGLIEYTQAAGPGAVLGGILLTEPGGSDVSTLLYLGRGGDV